MRADDGCMDIPSNEDPETLFSWALGDDYDCETCGSTWNEAELDLNWDDEGTWMFSYRAGCYGGDSVLGTEDGAKEKLEVLLKELSGYPEWSSDIGQKIRSLVQL